MAYRSGQKSKVVAITGAASGIGLACSEPECLAAGAAGLSDWSIAMKRL